MKAEVLNELVDRWNNHLANCEKCLYHDTQDALAKRTGELTDSGRFRRIFSNTCEDSRMLVARTLSGIQEIHFKLESAISHVLVAHNVPADLVDEYHGKIRDYFVHLNGCQKCRGDNPEVLLKREENEFVANSCPEGRKLWNLAMREFPKDS